MFASGDKFMSTYDKSFLGIDLHGFYAQLIDNQIIEM